MRDRVLKEIKDYLFIIIGTVMLTVGVYFFKIPNGFATGGVSGIGTILGKVTPNVSAGSWIMIINVVLLLLGFTFLGRSNGIKTVFCSLLFSGLTYALEFIVPLTKPLTDQPLLELVYAMLLTAFGSAIIFNVGASSGGTDIAALILKKYTSLDVGKALLIIDFFVAASSFAVFSVEAGLFSMAGLFAKAFLVDSIIDNINSCKYFVVITDKPELINAYIMKELNHSSTITEAIGSYSQEGKVMIHTVCKRIEAIRLRVQIKQIDPSAFVIITTTSEIIGRGFRSV
ncbi:MAG: YitT family protein [Clostridia bacterium]|nr:YitT family protein [Clostridia bacterium]